MHIGNFFLATDKSGKIDAPAYTRKEKLETGNWNV
jgi:hypothetical protein